MKILICGGAGYIGSHMVKLALDEGHEVTVIDNLSTGHADAMTVLNCESLNFVQADIANTDEVSKILKESPVDLVMHFCAHSLVGESVRNPIRYYQNNVGSTLSLLEAMRVTDHDRLVFSSSAAVYGSPQSDLIDEFHPCLPINPYGHSKLMVEQILKDSAEAYGLNSVCLRYFNAAGAHPAGNIGEKHDPETHLIPNILKSLMAGAGEPLRVFGTDYPTADGSCIRDYIHVDDLSKAHLLAGDFLKKNLGSYSFNLGTGKGYSVLEVIKAAEKVSEQAIHFEVSNRRPGDPASLVADATKAGTLLNWVPKSSDLESIVASAWNWHKSGEKFG